MKILQLCFRVPFPPHDGGAIAMYSITKGLNEAGHQVTVLAFNTGKHFQNEDVLNGIAELKAIPIDTTIRVKDAFFNLFKKLPYNIERFKSKDFEISLIDLIKSNQFDVVHFEGLYVCLYTDVVKKYFNGPCVLRTHNLEFKIWQRLAENEKNIFKKWYLTNLSSKLKRFESQSYQQFDSIASISSKDTEVLKSWNDKIPVISIPHGTYIPELNNKLTSKPMTMCVLSAWEWLPNREGLIWFLENVWNLVSEKLPDLEVHIAGKRTPDSIKELKLRNVFIHGFVPDATEFLQSYDLMLVPLLSGSGVRVKIIEGMAAGKCILTSTVGAEGIDYTDGKNIIIRDTPQQWADTIVNYFKNKNKYSGIGENARDFIKSHHENKLVIEKLVGLYKSLLN